MTGDGTISWSRISYVARSSFFYAAIKHLLIFLLTRRRFFLSQIRLWTSISSSDAFRPSSSRLFNTRLATLISFPLPPSCPRYTILHSIPNSARLSISIFVHHLGSRTAFGSSTPIESPFRSWNTSRRVDTNVNLSNSSTRSLELRSGTNAKLGIWTPASPARQFLKVKR